MYPCRRHWSRTFSSTRQTLKTHYDTLGVSVTASSKEIKKRFFELSKQLHPDKTRSLGPAERHKHSTHFRHVKEAYDVLSSKKQRAEYDRSISHTSSGRGMGSQAGSYSPFKGETGVRRTRVYYNNKYKARRPSNGHPDIFNPGHKSGSNYDVPHFDYDKHLKHQESYEVHRQKRYETRTGRTSSNSDLQYMRRPHGANSWGLGKIAGVSSTFLVILYAFWR